MVHYFAQIGFVNWTICDGNTIGLEHFIQANPHSFLSSINMLGWTFMAGLSSFFMALALRRTLKFRIVSTLLFIHSCLAITGGVSFLVECDVITFICMNPGIGGVVMGLCVINMLKFGNLQLKSNDYK